MSRCLVFSLILAAIEITSAQNATNLLLMEHQDAFKLAVRLERLEQYEEAEELYLELLKENPRDTRVYLQLKSMFSRLRTFDKLETLIRERLTHFPNDIQSHAELGELFLNQGKEKSAFEYWDNVLHQHSNSKIAYQVLLQMYLKHQMEEQVNDLVEKGRQQFNDPSFFSLELGTVYARLQDYEKATDEFITYAIYHPRQVPTISNYLLRLSDQEESVPFIEARLTVRIDENREVILLLHSDLLFKIGRYDSAFDHHQALGLQSDDDLDRWLKFADNLRKENQLPLALDAFSAILQTISENRTARSASRYSKLTGRALYGLALTYEKQIVPEIGYQPLAVYFPNNLFFEDHFYRLNSTDILPLEETSTLYDSILTALPQSSFSPQVHYRLGEIKYRITQDFDGALSSFEAARTLSRDNNLRRDATTRVGDVIVAKGDMNEAGRFFERQLTQTPSAEDQQVYLMKQCYVLFLAGETDTALANLDNLIEMMDVADASFNDALELKGFVEENYVRASEEERKAFRGYLRGERAMKQAKLAEAQLIFAEVSHNYPQAPIVAEATFRKAMISRMLGSTDAAITDFMALQDSPVGDLATVAIGEIYDRELNKPQEAVQWYLTVLETYPESVLVEPVRYRIRQIQSETDLN
ncbi:MAG: hypothetical protein QF669_03875 [Candidatus Marinimicrobia bacterium]|nr:hypothetical protein [Candidatus Neomarinimicrobiota bacterium]|tara:strand:+ start:2238 stop:4169 length:1932 start_codon:yes stop_codon:yes gene_type:complete